MSRKKSYNGIPAAELKQFLEEKYLQYNNPSFIECDPISIPHRYTSQNDREIAGFLAATIAWGRRDLILRSSRILMESMGNSPYEFIMSAGDSEMKRFSGFVHSTFNEQDCIYFMKGLKIIYSGYRSIEDVIIEGMKDNGALKRGIY